jgi:hypothetical protein
VTVPVDPLFVLLPILEKEASSNFVRFSDILPDDVGLLEPMVESRVASMCDFQGTSIYFKTNHADVAPGLRVYRFSPDKTMTWLKAKVDRLAQQHFPVLESVPEYRATKNPEDQRKGTLNQFD